MVQLIRRWSEKDVLFLKRGYENMSSSELGLHLNRTELQVQTKLSALGLTRTMPNHSGQQAALQKLFAGWDREQDRIFGRTREPKLEENQKNQSRLFQCGAVSKQSRYPLSNRR